MADLSKFKEDPQEQLLSEIQGSRCLMLGSPIETEHMQPMAPQIDDEMIEDGERVIYFYSDNTSDLGRAVLANAGAQVDAVYIDDDYQASLRGSIYPVNNPELVERFWNSTIASWYPENQSDPKMLMLKFVPREAAIWASTGNPLKFAYETAKANMTDTQPDVGEHDIVDVQAA